MPSVTKKQHNFMEAVKHNADFAKKVGVPQSVGAEFSRADKGRKFGDSKMKTKKYAEGGKLSAFGKAFRDARAADGRPASRGIPSPQAIGVSPQRNFRQRRQGLLPQRLRVLCHHLQAGPLALVRQHCVRSPAEVSPGGIAVVSRQKRSREEANLQAPDAR